MYRVLFTVLTPLRDHHAVASALAVLLSFVAVPVLAVGQYGEEWGAIKTEHFVLHYHSATESMAEETANMLEAAHDFVCDGLGWEPTARTHVVLEDYTDSPNGLASTVPHNDIRLNGVAPAAVSSLGYYDNWMWNLVVHEYAHIVHISRVGGIPRVFNLLTNGELRPNQALPRWFVEGLATWFESEASGLGRIESAYFDAHIYSAALDRNFPTLGELSGSPLDFPYATGWYLYGSRFLDYVIRQHGLESVAEFMDVYGRQVVPFRINTIARRTIGDGFVDMWPAFVAESSGEAWAQHVQARVRGAPQPSRVTSFGHRSDRLAMHPSGALAWIRDDGHSERELVVDGTPVVSLDSTGPFDFLDEETAVISLQHTVERAYSYRDLYALDLRTGETTALTWGARANEPAVSPDQTRVAFTASREGRTEIAVLDVATQAIERVVTVDDWEQASDPAWLDDEAIVFTLLRPLHGRDLFRVDLATGAVEPLTQDGATATAPFVYGGDVFFSSDRGGLFDLYRLDDEELVQLTHTSTGYFSPVILSVDGAPQLHFAELRGRGFDIASIELPAGQPAGEPRTPARVTPLSFPDAVTSRRNGPPIRGLRVPDLAFALGVTSETQALGVTLATSDPGANAFSASVQWATEFQRPVGSLTFTNRRLPVAITLAASRGLVLRDERLRAGSRFVPYVEEQYRGSLAFSVPFRRIGGSHSFSVSYNANWFRFLDEPTVENRPEDLEPVSPDFIRFNSLRLGWAWRDIDRDAHAFGTNRGSAVDVALRLRSAVFGAEVETAELTANGTKYAELPWRHVLALRVSGGISEARDAGRRQYAIGGLAPHDVFLALQESTPVGTFHVRGHLPSARSGNRYLRGHVEYRFPLIRISSGAGTLPVFLERLNGAIFVDAGLASSRNLVVEDGIYGVGAELRLSTALGYTEAADFRMGLARGFGVGGIWDAYLVYGFEF